MPGLVAALFALMSMVQPTGPGAARRPEPTLGKLAPGQVRILESYPRVKAADGFVDLDYLVLDANQPLRLQVGGPASVLLLVRSQKPGEVSFGLTLGKKSDEVRLALGPSWPRLLPCKIPAGTHTVSLLPDTQVLVRIASVQTRPSGQNQSPAPQSQATPSRKAPFWEYQPDDAGFFAGSDLGFWVTAGFGGGAQLDPTLGGWSWAASLNLRHDHYLVQLRYVHSLEWENQETGPLPSESVWELAPLFGLGFQGGWGWLSGSVGLGLVGGSRRGEYLRTSEDSLRDVYEQIEFLTVGVPLDLQIFATPYSCLGLGLEMFVNLNLERPFFGVLLAFQLGQL